jgi:hypothetical protein
MIERFSSAVAVFAGEEAAGYRSLSDHGQTFFAAWDSPRQGEWVVELAWSTEEDPTMPSGLRASFALEGAAGYRSELQRGLENAWRQLLSS